MLSVEGHQIEEAVCSLFHTLLLHRTVGKFHYKQEGTYSTGTVGVEDVDCDFVDFTYVRVASDTLDEALKKEVALFRDALRNMDGAGSGQISLEFYQRKRARWPFPAECIPWEVWTVKLEILTLNNESERQICREKLGEMLGEKVLSIADLMNRHDYIPKMPNQAELDLIFDTNFPDVQPYLFKISHQTTTGACQSSVGTTMRKFVKDTLAL
ncbi:autophagy-related protein 101-like isoform X2 [Ostrea edulis]|uniref:autophagy-related protein 101-like isoform X2 n=1 Tax=Ostrea edulis TaxID=37623 RepID=UPI0020940B3D|nr:autophagy-related protein 101-like isoform X2 [Ostrea edulis]